MPRHSSAQAKARAPPLEQSSSPKGKPHIKRGRSAAVPPVFGIPWVFRREAAGQSSRLECRLWDALPARR